MPKRKMLQDRFWSHVHKTKSCWLWTGAKAGRGYGYFWFGGRAQYAHRLAYSWCNGEIPPGKFVLHSCDVPACVNPKHLSLGDARTNAQDKVRRRRSPPSPCNGPLSKLTWKQVDEMRLLYMTGDYTKYTLCCKYQVSYDQLRRILSGRAWVGVGESETRKGIRERCKRAYRRGRGPDIHKRKKRNNDLTAKA